MSSEKIQLPDFLLADLYKDCLVEIESRKTESRTSESNSAINAEETTIHQAKTLKYLGENKSAVAIIVNQPESLIINDSDLALLTNILKACNLHLGDIAIVNNDNQEVFFASLKEQLDAKKIILFNVEPSSINLPFSIPHFQVHNYAGCIILTAPALSILNQQTDDSRLLKSKLWASLKQLFSI